MGFKANIFADVVPNVRDHGVKPPPASTRGIKAPWLGLSADLKKAYLSHFARFGAWSEAVLACYDVPPAIQEQADTLRKLFLAHPQRETWAGDFPGEGS